MKLIASDLDGTLLNNEGKVSEENIKAIRKAMDLGITFVVATGRSYDSAKKILDDVNLKCPIICMNGAAIFDEQHQLIYSEPLPKETARQVLSICEEANLYMELFTNKTIYSNSRENFQNVIIDMLKSSNPDVSPAQIERMVKLRFQEEKVQFIENYESIFSKEDEKIFKVLCMSLEEDGLARAFEQLQNVSELEVTSSGRLNIEINHKRAQKGIALEIFSEKLGIEMKDVMALGDNLNDKSMLESAGRGVAMGNARKDIKELCDYTTKTNDESGVAYAIEEMLQEVYAK